MRIGAGIAAVALTCVAFAPAAHAAGEVGGKGPRIVSPDGRRISMAGRPVFVLVDGLARFGDKQVATAPPLEIQVVGDVEITPLEDGGLRIVFIDSEESEE